MIAQGSQNAILMPPLTAAYSESRQHFTEIFRSSDGTESRRSQSADSTPLRIVSIPWSAMDEQEANLVLNIIQNGLDSTVMIPLWLSMTRLTAPVVSSATLPCDTTDREFASVTKALVVDVDFTSPAIGTISSITDSTVVLTSAVGPYAASSFVVPIITASPGRNTASSRMDYDAAGSCDFVETTGWANYTPDISSWSTYSGYPIFDPAPDGGQSTELVNDYELVGELWQQRTKVVNEVTELVINRDFFLKTYADRALFREFFDSRKGSATAFWIIERRASLILYAAATAGASSIQVDPFANTTSIGSLSKRYVRSRTTGDVYLLSNPVAGSTYNTFDVTPVIATALAVDERLDNLLFVRFDDDTLDLNIGRLESHTEIRCKFRELQGETP